MLSLGISPPPFKNEPKPYLRMSSTLISRISGWIICGTANNQLVEPVRDGRALKERGIVYAPDFVANAGGLIRLAGLYLGMTEAQIDAKVAGIERTTHEVLRDALSMPSTAEAAIAFAKRRIEKKAPVAAS